MFKSLREKLKKWTEKISKPKNKKEQEIEEKAGQRIQTKDIKERKIEKAGKIQMPMKYNPGLEKFEPDFETLKKEVRELEEEAKPGTKSFFKKIKQRTSKIKISEKEFEVYKEELETLLLENNVALEVSDEIINKLKQRVIGKEFLKKEAEEEIKDTLKEIISEILITPLNFIEEINKKKSKNEEPYIILFFGINGSGKTTTIAKIAEFLKNKKLSCVIAASDTFRAASIEQIKEHGKRIKVRIISHEYGSDPASVGFDAINYAKKNHLDCVLIDTAGRMHTEKNLIKEMEKINRVCNPDLKIFVGESVTGNDVIEQARTFNWNIGIDGIILTKADIDEKGGTALSIGFVTQKPILFLGTGQEYNSIEPFDKNKFLDRLGL